MILFNKYEIEFRKAGIKSKQINEPKEFNITTLVGKIETDKSVSYIFFWLVFGYKKRMTSKEIFLKSD